MRALSCLIVAVVGAGCSEDPDAVAEKLAPLIGNWRGEGTFSNDFGRFDVTVDLHLAPFEGELTGEIRAIGEQIEAVANVLVDDIDDRGDVAHDYDDCEQSGDNAREFGCPFGSGDRDEWQLDGKELEIDSDGDEFDGFNHVDVTLEET